LAAKSNTDASQIDKSAFFWVGRCGICHPGGGPGEFDRWGQKYFDPRNGEWGFEKVGKTVAEVGLDGDYTFVAGSGVARPQGHPTPPAAWDKTWTSEPDCLFCHAAERTLDGQKNMNWIWRTATIRSMAGLVDSSGNGVPAFMAAAAAGQGWFSKMDLAPPVPDVPPTATVLDLDYTAGITSGELVDANGSVALLGDAITRTPRDASCWGCHATPDLKKRARVWFDGDRDVHYRYWSGRSDNDPANDIAPDQSQVCSKCHEAGFNHQITKGDPFEGTVAAEFKYANLLSCRDCHADGNTHDAPVPKQDDYHTPGHLDRMSCQVCHIPHKESSAQLVVDNATSGVSTSYNTDVFLSADPLDPQSADKSRWFPSYHVKPDSDGVERLFPAKLLNVVWWGAWYHGADGLPNTADDFVRPIALWRIRKVTGGSAIAGTTDDNGDGTAEVNLPDEIRAYIALLRNDPMAATPGLGLGGNDDPNDYVLVKGDKVWWLDGDGLTGTVEEYHLHAADPANPNPAMDWLGAKLESATAFSIDHNVLEKTTALADCRGCHVNPSPNLLGRKILVDPFGPTPNAEPIYENNREIMRREGFRFFGN